ncbi:hypothetical protein DXG03_003468 [Asterophora parasitica]|uniref:F-box domain-containing protein n=1 Tax=Asterophora parasitica TaxID=117018 RepID=A0A9P7GAE6_9AGAR|nr:hypothetical protein DXG03_003468 [Asterophora parasitica]
MFLLQLPVELLDAICEPVRPVDLVSFARTSSSIYPSAQRLLYRHLSLSSHAQNLRAVFAIARKPELARHVRTFSLRLDTSPVFGAFYRLLGVALSSMTELTSLDLFVDPTASWILSQTRHAYPRLLHFASSLPLDDHVAGFLRRTDALLELEIDGSIMPISLPAPILPVASLPRLSQFVGPSHVASAIVPGRPVESIHLPTGDLTVEDVISLANTTAHVVVFGATTSSLPILLLDALSQPPKPSFYEQVATVLTSLPDLKGFELAGMQWGPTKKATQADGNVWQSQPTVGDIVDAEDVDLDSDLFFAY